MKKLEKKWALITGSSRGIGQQIALGLAGYGCNIILHGRKEKNTEETVNMLKDFNISVKVVAGELDSEESVNKMINAVLSKSVNIDILYNNAGIQNEYKNIWKKTIKEWRDIFQINLFSLVQISNALIPGMIERGWGRVINTTSGIDGLPEMAAYGATKFALNKYTDDLSYALKDTGVTVNALDPGWLRTDLGGPDAEYNVETVLPGALAPVIKERLIPNGAVYHAHDYKDI